MEKGCADQCSVGSELPPTSRGLDLLHHEVRRPTVSPGPVLGRPEIIDDDPAASAGQQQGVRSAQT